MNQPQNFDKEESHSLNSNSTAAEIRKIIEEKVKEIRSYTPKVGVFGVTGVGKSSLCNALLVKMLLLLVMLLHVLASQRKYLLVQMGLELS